MPMLLLGRAEPACALRRCLEGEGLEVALVGDADTADRRARTAPFAAVVLDQLLPGGALELLARWRRDGLAVPVLALAARPGAEVAQCLEAGADGCVAPPFPPREVAARLRALLRRGCWPVLRVYDLEVDTARRTVRRAGRLVRLTPREYALLEFLARRSGKVVTRRMIWEALYGGETENTSNVVDVYVRYLRNKIDKGFDMPLILTRYGEGYLLRPDLPAPDPASEGG
jgi:DNA-binding response OmpR family regulator